MSGEHGAPHGKGQGSSQHQLVMSKYHREVKMESGKQISVCGYAGKKVLSTFGNKVFFLYSASV